MDPEIAQRFTGIDQRFSAIDQRFSAIDVSLNEVKADVKHLGEKLDFLQRSVWAMFAVNTTLTLFAIGAMLTIALRIFWKA